MSLREIKTDNNFDYQIEAKFQVSHHRELLRIRIPDLTHYKRDDSSRWLISVKIEDQVEEVGPL